MRLSWNEIKARAARFADEWKNAHYERGIRNIMAIRGDVPPGAESAP